MALLCEAARLSSLKGNTVPLGGQGQNSRGRSGMEAQVAVGDLSARGAPRRERLTAGVQEVTEFIKGSQISSQGF